jgi:hypothetical protein
MPGRRHRSGLAHLVAIVVLGAIFLAFALVRFRRMLARVQ